MTYRILYCPVLMNSASADPVVTAYWAFSSVSYTTSNPPPFPSPIPSIPLARPRRWSTQWVQRKIKNSVLLLFSSALSCVGENGLIFHAAAPFAGVELQRLRIDYQQPCGGLLPVITHPCLHPCLLQRFKNSIRTTCTDLVFLTCFTKLNLNLNKCI